MPGKMAELTFFAIVSSFAATRAAQGFMGGCGGDMGVREWRRVKTRRDEASEMRHIDEEIRAHLIGNRAEAGEIEDAGDGRATGDDQSIRLDQAFLFSQVRFALMSALASSMSFRMSAVMATFGGLSALIMA